MADGEKGSGGKPKQQTNFFNLFNRYYKKINNNPKKGISEAFLYGYKKKKQLYDELYEELEKQGIDITKIEAFGTKGITDEEILDKIKIVLTMARTKGIIKNDIPDVDKTVSQEVKDSGLQPFTGPPDEKKQDTIQGMDEQQGLMIEQKQPENKVQATKTKSLKPKTKAQLIRPLLRKKIGKSKTERTYDELLQEYKKPIQPIIDPKILIQEQELKKTQEALRKLELNSELKTSRLEQEIKLQKEATENFYKKQMSAEKSANLAQQQKQEETIKRLEQEYKSTLTQEQKTSENKIKDVIARAKAREAQLQKENEQKFQQTLKDLELKTKAGDRKEQENLLRRLEAMNQAQIGLGQTFENKLNVNEQKLQKIKENFNKLASAKIVDIKKLKQLEQQINFYEGRDEKIVDRTFELAEENFNLEDKSAEVKAETRFIDLEKKRAEKELEKVQFEKARLASELKQTTEVKEREQKMEPIISYLDNVTPFLTAPLLVLASNLLMGANKNADTAVSTVLSSGTLALMTYLRSTFRPEEIKQAIEDAQTLKPDKRVNKILKQAKMMPKPEPEPEPEPDPTGPSGGGDIPDEKGIDNRLLVLGGTAVGIGGGLAARKAYEGLPNFRQFFNGDFTMPGYNFLGPGTDLKERIASGLLPVDTLDKIAYEHDLLYSLARNEEQIREADKIMIKSIDKYLPSSIIAQGIKNILQAKINYEQKSLMDFSNKILEENKQTTKQQRNIYDTLLNEITYEQTPTTNVVTVEPELQPPEPVQDIKTTPPIKTIETMPPKSGEPETGLETKTETKAPTIRELRGTIKTRPVIYNPPPAIGPDRSRIAPNGGPDQPYKTIVNGKQVAPLRGAGFPDRAAIDQSDYINDDELKRGPGILKPKFIMPSVNILNRTEQEQYVDDLEFAMFDFVQDDSGGNDPNGTNPLLRDQNLSLGLRYQRAGVTINSLFGENLPDDPRDMPQKRIKELFLGESLIPEMKFLYGGEFEAQEFNLSEFEVDQYDVNNERTAVEMYSPYADFTDNQLLDQYIDTSVLYGIVP